MVSLERVICNLQKLELEEGEGEVNLLCKDIVRDSSNAVLITELEA